MQGLFQEDSLNMDYFKWIPLAGTILRGFLMQGLFQEDSLSIDYFK